MSEREGYPAGVPCWIDATEPDPAAAVDFYRGLFGWEFDDAGPEGAGDQYLIGRIRGGEVAAVSAPMGDAPPLAMWNTYVSVDDADVAAKRAEEAGGTVLAPPFDVPEAGRMAVLADPEGAVFCVWQAGAFRGAKVVNEHGALNFNTLNTRDVAAAERFYGALFGWGSLSLPGGPMWTLPGYGDHLEQGTPGLKDQMAAMGAPDGFIDVVAALAPIDAGDTATPAHWSVTFGVDDVHAVAARARELGGEVVQEPVDAPWTRVALLRDPQGATFIAGQFVPENAALEG